MRSVASHAAEDVATEAQELLGSLAACVKLLDRKWHELSEPDRDELVQLAQVLVAGLPQRERHRPLAQVSNW